MSWTHIEDTTPKARKPYRCELCDLMIDAGEVHVKRYGIGDEGMLSVRMHLACEKYSRRWSYSDWEDERDPFEFRRLLKEETK